MVIIINKSSHGIGSTIDISDNLLYIDLQQSLKTVKIAL